MTKLRLLTLILIAALIFSMAQVALAQDGGNPPINPVTDDQVNAISKKLYCPVCENVPLDVCSTQACADWRAEIRTMLEQGQTEEQILAYFVNRYGQRVLATPEARGFNLIVWIVPPIAVVIGAVVLIMALRRMAPTAMQASAPVSPAMLRYDSLDAEYVARLESELREMS